MSSAIASDSRKIFNPEGTRLPSSARKPTTKAMSVAIGIPQPLRPGPEPASNTYTPAGASMPPSAPSTGRAALRGSRSSPCTISRLISRPTTKKKIVINPSLIQNSSGSCRANWPMPTVVGKCQK